MALRVTIRKDTGTLWIVGTVKPAGMERGHRIRRRAGTDDRALAEIEAKAIEDQIIRMHHTYPAIRNRPRVLLSPTHLKPKADPNAKPTPRRRGFHSPMADAAGLDWMTSSTASIYVMQSAGLVKVGITRNLDKRLKQARTFSPVPVEVLYHTDLYIGVAGWCEHLAHAALADHHSHGEWFTCPAEVAIAATKQAVATGREIPSQWIAAGNDPSWWARSREISESLRELRTAKR